MRRAAIGARRTRPTAQTQRATALALVGLGLAALATLAYLLLPRAVVVLHPKTEAVAGIVELRIDSAGRVGQAGVVPARAAVAVIEVAQEVPTEGRSPAPEARANGTVTLVNRQGGDTVVPTGTVVMTPSGARFATAQDATLDATAGSAARVPVIATEPGPAGNVARLEISRILGPLATRLAVLNEEPTAGGGQGTAPMVTNDDRARVRAIAMDRARFDGERAIRADVRDDEALVGETIQVAVLEEQPEGEVGAPVGAVRFRARVRVSGTVYEREGVESAALAHWRPSAPTGYFIPPGTARVGAPIVLRVDGDAAVVRVPIDAVAIPDVDADRVREVVRGRAPDQARREIARLVPLAAEPRVRVEPALFGAAPWRVDLAFDLNPPPRG